MTTEEKRPIAVRVNHVLKDYGDGRGNFDISLDIREGETLGLVGENGAGKTTLIRQLMGFIRSDRGSIQIYGKDAYKEGAFLKQYIGYIPGEINFPDMRSGTEFLNSYGKSRGASADNFAYADQIISRLQLDVRAYPKRMSKGMKQKTAIVACMMLKSPVIIMDEPTIGLDPLMRDELLKLVLEQKQRGATMLMSSNTIEELERVCDHVALISQGRIIDIADVSDVKNRDLRDYKIEFYDDESYLAFLKGRDDILRVKPEIDQATLRVNKADIPQLFDTLEHYRIKYITEVKFNLSNYFDEKRKEMKVC